MGLLMTVALLPVMWLLLYAAIKAGVRDALLEADKKREELAEERRRAGDVPS